MLFFTIWLFTFIISSLAMIREVLILIGWLKGPVLARFEKYGDDEDLYFVLPPLLAWTGAFLISSTVWLLLVIQDVMPIIWLGLLLWGVALFLYHRWKNASPELRRLLLYYPRWQHELLPRTSRLERRRMAYMWLHLPPRLRLIYGGNERAFYEWADFVILATLM